MGEDRNIRVFDRLRALISVWRSPFAVGEDRNVYAVSVQAGDIFEWRSPFAVGEDRNLENMALQRLIVCGAHRSRWARFATSST